MLTVHLPFDLPTSIYFFNLAWLQLGKDPLMQFLLPSSLLVHIQYLSLALQLKARMFVSNNGDGIHILPKNLWR